jgi:type VI secretion system secreted protein VgrG
VSSLSLHFEGGEASLDVRRFSVHEAISQPFEVTVFCRSTDDDLDLEAFVGKGAGLSITSQSLLSLAGLEVLDALVPPVPRVWTGVVSEMALLRSEPTTAQGPGLSTYLVRIAPSLWLLGHRKNNRIFQHQTVLEIVSEVLGYYRIEAELRVNEKHEKHEYRVQFGETDLAFVSRLLEEEGLSYWFEQVEVGDKHKSKLVIGDQPQHNEPRLPLGFVDEPDPAKTKRFATNAHVRRRVRAGQVSVRDFDFVRPDFALVGRHQGAEPKGKTEGTEKPLELYAYEPAAYVKDRGGKPRVVAEPEANTRAQIALEAKRALARELTFESNAYDLEPGSVVPIVGHPRAELAAPVLVVEVRLEGAPDEAFSMSVLAASSTMPYRPRQRTKKPVMRGPESAIVVGAKGEEIHTDEHGRVRVQFHWDRQHDYDDKASCWVRVSQGWAGSAFGFVTLPRVAQEVIVDFLDGDPDQPIVVGRVYNQRTKQPYVLPAQATRTVWKSNSTPKSEGFNELSFEDKAGSELLYVQAERDLSKRVKVNETERVGANQTIVVGANRGTLVAANDSVTVGGVHTVAMASIADAKILSLGDPSVTPKTTLQETKHEHIAHTTGKATFRIDDDSISIVTDKDAIFQSGGTIVIDGKHVYVNSKAVSGSAPQTSAGVRDGAARPEGRVLDAIKKVFGIKKPTPPETPERKELEVPHRVQKGGTCGIAALGMVMDYWKAQGKDVKTPSGEDILKLAQDKGWTDTGGLWEDDNAKLAKAYGYEATYKAGATLGELKEEIGKGNPVLITFSVDNGAGDPKVGNDRGHYAVVHGFFEKDGKEYVVASHGWQGASKKVWEAKQFDDSWGSYMSKGPPPRKMVVVTPKGGAS